MYIPNELPYQMLQYVTARSEELGNQNILYDYWGRGGF